MLARNCAGGIALVFLSGCAATVEPPAGAEDESAVTTRAEAADPIGRETEVVHGEGVAYLVRTAPLDITQDLRFGSRVEGELRIAEDTGCLEVVTAGGDRAAVVLPSSAVVAGEGEDASVSVEGYPSWAVGDAIVADGVVLRADRIVAEDPALLAPCLPRATDLVAEVYVAD